MSKDALRRSLRAVSVVLSNREMRLLQLSWAAQSFSIWAFAIGLGVYAFDASGVDEARVGFDFQLTASIVFGE